MRDISQRGFGTVNRLATASRYEVRHIRLAEIGLGHGKQAIGQHLPAKSLNLGGKLLCGRRLKISEIEPG